MSPTYEVFPGKKIDAICFTSQSYFVPDAVVTGREKSAKIKILISQSLEVSTLVVKVPT